MPTNHHQQPLTPELVASADRMHARGHHLFNALVRDFRKHQTTCDDPDCDIKSRGEVYAVAAIAAELWQGLFRCGHQDCIDNNVKAICEALAYAGVRTAEGQGLDDA